MARRYALIGAGMMGQEHIRFLNYMDGAVVTAIADPDPSMRDQAAILASAETFADYRQLLEADLADALIIASPNHTHHDVLIDAMATDLPIMIEKPLCSDVDDAKEIARLASVRQAPVWVAIAGM